MKSAAIKDETIHATCVALAGAAPVGVLLRGPSGAGKSDLALRLVESGWRLVADDRCALSVEDGRLFARAPETLAGKMEVRGLGIVEVAHLARAPVALLVDLVPAETVARLPEPETETLLGVALPRLALHGFDPSAAAKLRLALQAQTPAAAPTPAPSAAASDGRRVVLVTGLSGAGRSTALNALEDLGYETIDNLPLELIEQTLADGMVRPLALGIDIRTRHFAVEPFLHQFERLRRDARLSASLLFLHCDDEVARRRFSETRRRHPLAQERPLLDGIRAERRLISPLRERADLVVDTSTLTAADLRRILTAHYDAAQAARMTVFVVSFSYREGLPRAADTVFDVRFLDNPHYQDALRPLTGKDPQVADYIRKDPDFAPFFARVRDMVLPLLPRYEREGKSYLTVAFGCTGGRHRSVMLAEALADVLRQEDWPVTLLHRDLGRADNGGAPRADSA